MATILITGCNRGIGLQLCTQFAARGDEVIGVCRSNADELQQLGFRVITGIDVGDAESISRLKESLGTQHLDVLINNAGILLGDSLGELDYTEIVEQFRVNTLGPLRVTEALLDNLSSGSKVVILSSRVGSIEDNSSGGYYGYRASKAAVNMIGTNLKHDLLPRGIAVGLLHPGMVATQMTNGQGVAPADAAKNIIDRIDGLDLQNSGGFWHAEGYELPW
ncbi:MAG: SDR family oxidoreductase [Woeseiaceae bacterium]|jgi:NAD(P)-dependent dehydrogenase (short-subunit alcohol dehydrogenase family)